MLVVQPGSAQFYTDFNNTYQILPPLFAALCGISYARSGVLRSRSSRLGWLLIGLGALSFTIGQSAWTLYESVWRVPELPSPGPADLGYVGAYPLLIGGIVLLFGSMPIAGRARLLLDSALAASGVAVLSWYFVVAKLWNNPDVTILGKLISVAYPLGDVAVLLCAIILLSGPTTDRSLRRSLAFLASGVILLAIADTAFTFYSLNGIYQTGSWFDWGWSFGWLLIGYASLLPLWWPLPAAPSTRPAAPPPPSHGVMLARTLAPYLAVGVAFTVVVRYDARADGLIQLDVLLAGLALILLVIVRQILTLLENQQLTAQLRTFSSGLEQMVVRRTEQLTALLQLTKAVNNTLQHDQVISAALEHTHEALQADAVTIRVLDQAGQTSSGLPRINRQTGLEQRADLIRAVEALPLLDRTEMLPLARLSGIAAESDGSYLRAPLLWQQRIVGMIGVARWQSSFSSTEADMLESIGVEVGAALENARLYASALDAADRDAVTGLYNHRAIQQRFNEEFLAAKQHNQALTILMVDLNNFKLFNDTYGHPVGDQVLKRVARVLSAQCREGDIVGRYGGDEFLVLLPGADATTAYSVAERLRDRMAREGFRRTGEQRTIPVTLSFGLATYPTDSANRHELLAVADANLYDAKQSEGGIRGTSDQQRANRELRAQGTFDVLDALIMAVDNKDRYTRRHSEDVTEYALWIAEELGLSEETMRIIRIGCLLHDVGKIGVADDILRKPGRLTPEEFDVMKRHPKLGALIVGALPGVESIIDIVRSHHERWDGTGYPDGLRGEEIPLLGRLVAIADAFSAMTTDRPYRKGMGWQTALAEIERNAGIQFDPAMVESFVHALSSRMSSAADQLPPSDSDGTSSLQSASNSSPPAEYASLSADSVNSTAHTAALP